MSKQTKQNFWIKIGLTCLGLLLLMKACGALFKIEDRLDSSTGIVAIQTIGGNMKIPIDTMKNAYYTIYSRGTMPVDLNMHYRFDIDRQVLDAFIKKHKFKADPKSRACFPKSSSRRNAGTWWQPAEVRSPACFTWDVESTDYYMVVKDLDGKTARVYIFGYNN